MKCPVCNLDLVMSERQGVEIDYCPKCRGVWLDRGELDKIIERSTSEMPQRQSGAVNYGHHGGKHHEQGHNDHHYKKKKAFFLSCSTKDHMKVNFKRMDNLHLRLQTIEASSNNKLVDGQTALAMAAKI